jgi:hypothetical protein
MKRQHTVFSSSPLIGRTTPRARLPLAAAFLAAGLAGGLTTSRAEAADAAQTVSPGLLFSLSIGDRIAFGLGVDVRYTATVQKNSGSAAGGGVFAQATWLNFSAGRFAAGIHGGGDIVPYGAFSMDGELGYTYRTSYDDATPGGHGLHLGLASYPLGIAELSFRGSIPFPGERHKPELTIGLGARFPFVFSPLDFGSGRPLRVGEERALPSVTASARRHCISILPIDGATRAELASAWLADARAEGSSIPAFLALAAELEALGAPRDLVDRALSAARDEQRHTAACLAIAGDLAGLDFALGPLSLPPPSRDSRAARLRRLAVESWEDGCLGEGLAADRARRSRGPVNAMIARDEQRHADLAWSVLAWAMAEGKSPVRDAVAGSMRGATPVLDAFPEAPAAIDLRSWARFGRLDRDGAAAAREATLITARREGEKLLGRTWGVS